ncbi:MAG: chitobiase/beta-hexosaminidase C-terminal domain-containing protein, partial [bacterium]
MSSKSLLGSIFVAVLTLILSSCTLHVVHVNAATEQSSGDKTPKIDVPATDVQLKVANPSITPDNRTPLAYGAEISMGCSTSGATIRYTTGDGSQDEPTATTGEEYDPTDKPIIEVASTFKAKAFKDNYTDSDTTTIAYKLTGHVGTSDLGEVS